MNKMFCKDDTSGREFELNFTNIFPTVKENLGEEYTITGLDAKTYKEIVNCTMNKTQFTAYLQDNSTKFVLTMCNANCHFPPNPNEALISTRLVELA